MSAKPRTQKADEELEEKIADAMKFGLPIVTAALAILAGALIDASTAVLILAAGLLVTVIAMFWASLRTLLGETPLSGADAYAIGAPPRAEEEQKRAVLRALKDLEFEKSVGKISEEDYKALVLQYRAEAKRLLQLLDEDAAPSRERAEALVQRRLKQLGMLEGDEDENGDEGGDEGEDEETEAEETEAEETEAKEPAPEPEALPEKPRKKSKKKTKAKASAKAAPEKEPEADAEPQRACASCGTENDEDALFCKKCGARMSADEVASAEDEGEGESERAEEEAS